MKKIISTLASDEMQGRESGKPGYDKAAAFVETYLKNAGTSPLFGNSYLDFLAKHPTYYNVIGVLKSKYPSQNPIIISAHLDHLGLTEKPGNDPIYNGANDDASGVTAALLLAQYFKKMDLKRDVIFAFFVGEEKGLLGSKHFAEKLKSAQITPAYALNIEMIGNPMATGNTAYLTGFNLSNMASTIQENSRSPFLVQAKIDEEQKLFFRSDNYALYKAFQIPAHTLSSFDFPKGNHYHQLSDETQNLDLKHMHELIQNIAYALQQMLEKNVKIEMNANAPKL